MPTNTTTTIEDIIKEVLIAICSADEADPFEIAADTIEGHPEIAYDTLLNIVKATFDMYENRMLYSIAIAYMAADDDETSARILNNFLDEIDDVLVGDILEDNYLEIGDDDHIRPKTIHFCTEDSGFPSVEEFLDNPAVQITMIIAGNTERAYMEGGEA